MGLWMLIVLTAKTCPQKSCEASRYCRLFFGSYFDSHRFLKTSSLRMILSKEQLLHKKKSLFLDLDLTCNICVASGVLKWI